MAEKAGKQKKPARRSSRQPSDEVSAVVGVGVCAASFRALLALFAGMDDGPEVAYVIAVRQQDGLSVDTVVEALKSQSRRSITKAKTGDRLQAGHVYVGGGTEIITITDGHIATRPSKEPAAHRGTIDSLLISLAEHA